MKNLKSKEYITVSNEGYINLTATGKEIAEKVYECHNLLLDHLSPSPGVSTDKIFESFSSHSFAIFLWSSSVALLLNFFKISSVPSESLPASFISFSLLCAGNQIPIPVPLHIFLASFSSSQCCCFPRLIHRHEKVFHKVQLFLSVPIVF